MRAWNGAEVAKTHAGHAREHFTFVGRVLEKAHPDGRCGVTLSRNPSAPCLLVCVFISFVYPFLNFFSLIFEVYLFLVLLILEYTVAVTPNRRLPCLLGSRGSYM